MSGIYIRYERTVNTHCLPGWPRAASMQKHPCKERSTSCSKIVRSLRNAVNNTESCRAIYQGSFGWGYMHENCLPRSRYLPTKESFPALQILHIHLKHTDASLNHIEQYSGQDWVAKITHTRPATLQAIRCHWWTKVASSTDLPWACGKYQTLASWCAGALGWQSLHKPLYDEVTTKFLSSKSSNTWQDCMFLEFYWCWKLQCQYHRLRIFWHGKFERCKSILTIANGMSLCMWLWITRIVALRQMGIVGAACWCEPVTWSTKAINPHSFLHHFLAAETLTSVVSRYRDATSNSPC